MSNKNQGYDLPDDIQEIYDAPLVMFCGVIPDHPAIRAALLGTVTKLIYWTSWEKTKPPDTRARDVALYLRDYILECFMIDCCSVMRDCIGTMLQPMLDKQNRDLLKELEDQYSNGGENSIAPNLVYDMTADDIKRDLVVCFMCREFINLIFDAEIKRREDQRAETYWTLHFISDFALIASAFLGPLASALALGAALGLKIAGIAGLLGQLADEVLNDDVARELVACCMTSALRGATPTFSRFQTSLDGCGFGVLQNAEYMRQIVQPLLDDLDVYLAFLKTGDSLWPYVEQGLLDICPCEGWTLDLDLTVTDGGFTIWDLGDGAMGGVWDGQGGDGWLTTNAFYAGNEARTFVSLELAFQTPVAVDSVQIFGNAQFGTWNDTNRPALAVSLAGAGFGISKDRADMSSGDFDYTGTGSGAASGIQMYLRTSRDAISPYVYDGAGSFTRIRITGSGTPPVIL